MHQVLVILTVKPTQTVRYRLAHSRTVIHLPRRLLVRGFAPFRYLHQQHVLVVFVLVVAWWCWTSRQQCRACGFVMVVRMRIGVCGLRLGWELGAGLGGAEVMGYWGFGF